MSAPSPAHRQPPGEHALVVARPGSLGELAFRLHLEPPGLPQPGLGGEGTLGRPDLEHLPPPAQRLADGTAAVDLLPRHERGTSR